MKLSQSPEAMAIKQRLREQVLGPERVDAAEHNRRTRQLMAEEAWQQRQKELSALRRQQAIDSVWEQVVAAKQEHEAQATARTFHRGHGDPDWVA